jgi:hypothetical protein
MYDAIRLLVALFVLAGSVRPALASSDVAQTDPLPLSALDIEQAREAFASFGFSLDRTLTWDWTSPPVQTFRVHDLSKDRVLMVFVYASRAAAEDARAQASVNQQISDASPRLADGFGESVWRNNIALIEARQTALDRLYGSDAWRNIGMPAAGGPAPGRMQPELVVDVDFQEALDSGTSHL